MILSFFFEKLFIGGVSVIMEGFKLLKKLYIEIKLNFLLKKIVFNIFLFWL